MKESETAVLNLQPLSLLCLHRAFHFFLASLDIETPAVYGETAKRGVEILFFSRSKIL